jgi:hypothetical protein
MKKFVFLSCMVLGMYGWDFSHADADEKHRNHRKQGHPFPESSPGNPQGSPSVSAQGDSSSNGPSGNPAGMGSPSN